MAQCHRHLTGTNPARSSLGEERQGKRLRGLPRTCPSVPLPAAHGTSSKRPGSVPQDGGEARPSRAAPFLVLCGAVPCSALTQGKGRAELPPGSHSHPSAPPGHFLPTHDLIPCGFGPLTPSPGPSQAGVQAGAPRPALAGFPTCSHTVPGVSLLSLSFQENDS